MEIEILVKENLNKQLEKSLELNEWQEKLNWVEEKINLMAVMRKTEYEEYANNVEAFEKLEMNLEKTRKTFIINMNKVAFEIKCLFEEEQLLKLPVTYVQ